MKRFNIELSHFKSGMQIRPREENNSAVGLSCLSGIASLAAPYSHGLHYLSCHPGDTTMLHFVRSKNLFSADDFPRSLTVRFA